MVGNHGARKVAEAPRKFCAEATSRDMLISFNSVGQDFRSLREFRISILNQQRAIAFPIVCVFVAMESGRG